MKFGRNKISIILIAFLFIYIPICSIIILNLSKFNYVTDYEGLKNLDNENLLKKPLNRTLQILIWTKFFGGPYWDNEKFKNMKCKYSNCNLSSDRKNLNISDALYFHWRDVNPNDMPLHQFPNQKWILMNLEPPILTPINNIKPLLKYVNWTMTYRRGSDVYIPYGEVFECERKWKPNYDFKQKRKSIAWVVSKCKTPSKRELYVKELQKHIDVDIYGKCGNHSCGYYDELCFQSIEKNYKFYLGFENSMCKDYVTEKLFRTIQYDIIPIVMGSEDYSSIMPYNSYIDVSNFSSPLHLVNYLKEIINDENRYKSYFEWKNNHCIRFNDWQYFCKLCESLNFHLSDKNKNNWEKDLIKWYFDDSNCKSNCTVQYIGKPTCLEWPNK